MTDDKLLRIYLNDHLAASTLGAELARRALSNNSGNEFEDVFQRLLSQIDDEREELSSLIDRIGGSTSPLKQAAAWAGEKAGRLKLNGRLIGYSPLSRLVEIEGLCAGIETKVSMWRALRQLAETDPRLEGPRLDELIEQGERQRQEMEGFRLRAVSLALSPAPPDAAPTQP